MLGSTCLVCIGLAGGQKPFVIVRPAKAPTVRLELLPVAKTVSIDGALTFVVKNKGPRDVSVLFGLAEKTLVKEDGPPYYSSRDCSESLWGDPLDKLPYFKIRKGQSREFHWKPLGQKKSFKPEVGHQYVIKLQADSSDEYGGPFYESNRFKIVAPMHRKSRKAL